MIIPYELVKWYWVTGHYDVHWSGYGWHNGKCYRIKTTDNTDYDTMTESCPSCKVGGSDDYKECHCEVYTDLQCELTELSYWQIAKMYISKFIWDWVERTYLMHQFRKKTK